MNWINYFKEIAHVVKSKSKDENFKVGAVIVAEDKSILSTGYNSFPRGIESTALRQSKPPKYYWIEHAERNAIYNAAKNGIKLDGATIYLTASYPCADCARAIINSGRKTIYCHTSSGPYNTHWINHYKVAEEMLKEAGIQINFYEFTRNHEE